MTSDSTNPFWGSYRLRREIGRGGMGVVYEAWDDALERTVALKVLLPRYARQPDAVRRFLREAQTAGQLSHPNIVKVYEVGSEKAGCFFTMEYVDGQTVKHLLKQLGRLPAEQALDIAAQVASALTEIHDKGLVHRDIKPHNIILGSEGVVKVTDFGIARVLAESGGLTLPGVRLGTPAYMSPEQCQGKPLTPKSDLYSLGVCLYEMLSGNVPYQADTVLALLYQIIHEPFPPLATACAAPPLLARLVALLTVKDPADRYPSSAQLAHTLTYSREQLLDANADIFAYDLLPTPHVTHAPDEVKQVTGTGRRNLLLSLVAAGLCISGIGTFMYARRNVKTGSPPVQPARIPAPPPAPAAASGLLEGAWTGSFGAEGGDQQVTAAFQDSFFRLQFDALSVEGSMVVDETSEPMVITFKGVQLGSGAEEFTRLPEHTGLLVLEEDQATLALTNLFRLLAAGAEEVDRIESPTSFTPGPNTIVLTLRPKQDAGPEYPIFMLQGAWTGVYRTQEGEKQLMASFRRHSFQWYQGEDLFSGRFSVNRQATPMTIDLTAIRAGGVAPAGVFHDAYPGLIRIEDDLATFAWPAAFGVPKKGADESESLERPTSFTPGPDTMVVVLHKQNTSGTYNPVSAL